MRVSLTKDSFIALPKLSSLLLGLGAVLFGCSGAPTSVEPTAPPPSLAVSGGTQVVVLKRHVPLSVTKSVSQVIGPQGGTLTINGAGIRVVFPAGALAAPVRITVTAPAGRLVAYAFGPHGLKFGQAVRVEVSLKGTQAANNLSLQNLLEAGYFNNSLGTVESTGMIMVSERLPLRFDATRSKVTFGVRHFSGYLLASGKR